MRLRREPLTRSIATEPSAPLAGEPAESISSFAGGFEIAVKLFIDGHAAVYIFVEPKGGIEGSAFDFEGSDCLLLWHGCGL